VISVGLGTLIVWLVAATVTDIRTGRIPNTLTYSGMLVGFALAVAGVLPLLMNSAKGWSAAMPTPIEALAGWGLCGGLMVFCYTVFAGQIGGGDVKLMAMVGTFLGPYAGLEVLLWTFVIGAAFAGLRLIWTIGIGTMFARGSKYVIASLRARRPIGWDDQDRAPLRTPLFLAPCTLAAMAWVTLIAPRWSV